MATKRVLLPIDFSPQQEAVIAQGAYLAKSMSAEIILLHSVVSPEISVVAIEPVFVPASVMERFTRDHTIAATNKLEKIAEGLRKSLAVKVVIKYSDPVDAILSVAEEYSCEAIVMGSHGAGLDRFLLGSVAESVTRNAPSPVVVAKNSGTEICHFKNVIVGIDFSAYSAPLVALARRLSHPEATIHLVHSWHPSSR